MHAAYLIGYDHTHDGTVLLLAREVTVPSGWDSDAYQTLAVDNISTQLKEKMGAGMRKSI